MRRNALRVGMIALALAAGCKATTKFDPTRFASIEVDPRGALAVAPPRPGDVSRKFPANRGQVAKAVFRNLSTGIGEGDFAMDQDRGRWFFQKDVNVQDRVRQLRGRGPGGHFLTVEIRPEGTESVAIVRGTPKVDEAVALVLLDKVEEDLKAGTAEPKAR